MAQQIFIQFNTSEFYEELHTFTAIPITLDETQARNFARKWENNNYLKHSIFFVAHFSHMLYYAMIWDDHVEKGRCGVAC